jgi:CheY-like chemotaxis protein/two-component sensor histidine kinase
MDELAELQRSNVVRIMRSAKHLLNLLNEILEISRIEAGRLAVELEPVKIADGIREASEFVQPLLEERGIRLRIETSAFPAATVLADQQKMIQVFLNLLSNAVKYNREKGEIAVTLEIVERTDVRVNVTDTGEGISPESQLKLFQPFERLGADRTKTPGTGLGLALSKKMVELMRGTIGVQSAAGEGSTFWVQFPLYQPTGPEPEVAAEPTVSTGPTVLYIEDALLSIHLIKGILKRATPNGNVRVISAIQGNLGLEMARIHTPDLILLDLHLPDLSGIQVLTRLKEDARTSSIPVVVLTADALPGTRGQVLEAGALDCLLKPVNVAQFLERVKPILEVSTT